MGFLAESLPLIRDSFSMDFDDLIALLLAAAALLKVFWPQITRSSTSAKTVAVEEQVDESVLGRFLDLTDRVAEIKAELAMARTEIKELRNQVAEYARDEAAYQAELHAKDVYIEELRVKLVAAREERAALAERVEHLEVYLEDCRKTNGNGE